MQNNNKMRWNNKKKKKKIINLKKNAKKKLLSQSFCFSWKEEFFFWSFVLFAYLNFEKYQFRMGENEGVKLYIMMTQFRISNFH